MIMSIVDYHHWTPKTIKKMYVDDYDFEGIIYWYDELVRIDKESKKKIKK
jgi:hypothetical protein